MYEDFAACARQLKGVQAIDYHLARSLCIHLHQESNDLLFHSILMLSAFLRDGHICVNLQQEQGCQLWQDENGQGGYRFPAFQPWYNGLQGVGLAADAEQPLVLELDRLYLRRYWYFETRVAARLRQMLATPRQFGAREAAQSLSSVFPGTDALDQQRLAVANALGRRLAVIAGGPGTGKTYTVARLLVAIGRLCAQQWRIALAAPTGKAAQRLNESLLQANQQMLELGVAHETDFENLPRSASTVHRLLGVIPGSHEFRHNRENPLAVDLLLLDEASMLDLPLMYRLLEALPDTASLVLLGDADQLPSVAAGSVLGDLCPRPHPGFSDANRHWLQTVAGHSLPVSRQSHTADHLLLLNKSRRFSTTGGVGQLAAQVLQGDATGSWSSLKQDESSLTLDSTSTLDSWLDVLVRRFYQPVLSAVDARSAFSLLQQFRILCATRIGPFGVEQVNQQIEALLYQAGLIHTSGSLYKGRPVMVTSNHYELGLYNGDIGLLWPHQGRLQVAFPQEQTLRWLSVARLPDLQTVYAMTIHKTQGSEYDQVALLLPQHPGPLLSRELLYTGLTRARNHLHVKTTQSIWQAAVARQIRRYSGLAQRLG